MQYSTIRYAVSEHILTITLDRPEKYNAFTVEMSHELIDAFQQADRDDNIRAIIVTGEGKAFCAGMDLSVEGNVFGLDEEVQIEQEEDYRKVRDTGGTVTLAMYECRKPIIGAINGVAVGVGATLTLAMDFRLLSEKARYGFVFSKLGIVNEACSSWFLPKIVGIQQTLEWLYKGNIFDAAEALEAGLAKSVHAPDDLLAAATAMAKSFTQEQSQVSIGLIRQMVYNLQGAQHPLEAHKAESLGMFITSLHDGKEGVAAFAEKRPIQFTGNASTDMPNLFIKKPND